MLLYVTFSGSGRSCYPVPVDMTTAKGNLRNSGGIPAENAPWHRDEEYCKCDGKRAKMIKGDSVLSHL